VRDDHNKKKLLNLARQLSPMKTALRIRLLRHTVLPRLLCQYLTWIVLIAWGGTAALAYNGITEPDIEDGVFTGAGTMVTFMIIFYVGYCYNRYTQQFDEVQTMMRSVISVCAEARVNFDDPDEANRIYRYLNMLHILCYTGLSPTYSVHNFFLPLAEKHMLFGVEGSEAFKQEQHHLSQIDIDKEGGRAWQMMYLWCLQVVKRQALAGALTPPIHAQLNKELSTIADCCGNLFACSYQVLPFIYTQLVSFACTVYLVVTAFLKGVLFTPDQSLTYGLIVPFINVFLTTFTIFGLLEVGDTIMDPFGNDPEDYAIVHFVEHTAQASNEAMLSPDAPPPTRERGGAHLERERPERDSLASTAMLTTMKERSNSCASSWRQAAARAGHRSVGPARPAAVSHTSRTVSLKVKVRVCGARGAATRNIRGGRPQPRALCLQPGPRLDRARKVETRGKM